MMEEIIVAGGGMAGLTLAYFLAEAGRPVLVIEAKNYPRTRVCGEYLSLESIPLLERMGITLPETSPLISRLQIHTGDHKIEGHLPLGALGISRYYLDDVMYQACLRVGARFRLNTRIQSVVKEGSLYRIDLGDEMVETHHFINATGKAPSLGNTVPKGMPRYMAVKFHLEDVASDPTIALYQYHGGYCGSSLVEGGKRCVCYLVRQELTEKAKGLDAIEARMAASVPALALLLNNSKERIRPIAISNFTFGYTTVSDAIGDSRYLVPPLTGNGMTLAIRDGYKKARQVLGQEVPGFVPNSASLLVQKLAESSIFSRLIFAMRRKPVLDQIIESTFGPII